MPLFDKGKKSGHIKSLSEEEIQKKLYGTFQEGNARLLPEEQYRDQSVYEVEENESQFSADESASVYADDIEDSAVASDSLDIENVLDETEEEVSSVYNPSSSELSSVLLDDEVDEETDPGYFTTEEKDLFSIAAPLSTDPPAADLGQSDLVEELLENEESQDLGYTKDENLFHIEHPENNSAIKDCATEYSLPSDTHAAEEILSEFSEDEMTAPLDDEPVPDSVAFTYDADEDLSQSGDETPQEEKEDQSLSSILSSFKIDLAEFFDKLKRISPFLIGGIVLFLVFFFVVFNIWIRSSSKGVVVIDQESISTTEDTSDFVAVKPVSVRASQRDVVVTPVNDVVNDSESLKDDAPVITPPVLESFYTFQICVYGDTERAGDLVDSLKGQGLDAFYEQFTTRSGRVLYNVYSGRYGDSGKANAAFKEFKRSSTFKQFPDSFIKWHK